MATVNPFSTPPTSAIRAERIVFATFRLATYAILLAATFIFGVIFVKGSSTVFTNRFPFVNVAFLTQSPETLHVFTKDSQVLQMGDKEFRQMMEKEGNPTISDENYVYSAGGIFPCIVGTVFLVVGSMAIALLVGISSAVFLNEYSRGGRVVELLRLAILNLAGVPSIVFGLFGFGLFVLFAPKFQSTADASCLSIPLGIGYLNFCGWGVSLLSGWFTLAFMVLPVVITASEESLKAVPKGFRDGSLALGATQWEAIRTNVLPYALPGILTSSILGIARVAGETAPIMFTAAYVVRDRLPWQVDKALDVLFQGVMALPYHIYVVASKIPQNEYTERVQFGTAFVFLAVVLAIAMTSVILRSRMRARYRW
ncbi:MAG: phosphate transporter, permease protein PstA [Verrucomicrobiota bacterium]|jgi:phosphate transport system permease protein